jgi:hypothetical protein
VLLAGMCAACSGDPQFAITQLSEARRLAQELLVHLTKASDATNRAVMADTDESSALYARESGTEAQIIQTALVALDKVLRRLDYTEELGLVQEFRGAYAKYLELDREILALAVENTNLKATQLSFGPMYEAATSFQATLDSMSHAVSSNDACSVQVLVLTATRAVRELEVLQAQHIAESKDEVMTDLERRMAKLEADARAALAKLADLHGSQLQPALTAANAALTQCMSVHGQLIGLSRRNSNVRSQALALGPKPRLLASCEQSLRALSKQLGQRKFIATR